MFSKTFRLRMRTIHRWAGLIIGIQLLFWVISGAYFSWISIDFVKGKDRTKDLPTSRLDLDAVAPLSALDIPEDFQLTALHLESLPRGLYFIAVNQLGKKLYFAASSGSPLDMLAPEAVLPLVLLQEQDAAIDKTILLENQVPEFKGQLPVYQVSLNDGRLSKLYVDPYTGKILARRNQYWRIYDFLWMLHIMDFKEREDFNNAFLRALSLGALGVILSGYFLFSFGKMPFRKRKTFRT